MEGIRRTLAVALGALVVLGTAASWAPAQSRMYRFWGEGIDERFGDSVDILGDVNGDGCDDVIVGDANAGVDGQARCGRVLVYSGKDGSELYRFEGQHNDQLGMTVSAAGDVNGDGSADFLLHARLPDDRGRVEVRSGADGSLLYALESETPGTWFGKGLASLGDVNDDGIPDIAVSSPLDTSDGNFVGRVWVLSGIDGSIIHTISGGIGALFGYDLSSAGDVDADGTNDILVGAAALNIAFVHSGRDGSRLLVAPSFPAPSVSRLGMSLSAVGDLDGDGHDDFLVGFPYIGTFGTARVFSGRDGSVLHDLFGSYYGDFYGCGAAGIGDIDFDGVPDFAVGADHHGETQGSVTVYSGADGSIQYQLVGPRSAIFGHRVAGEGDVNGDGVPDIVVSAYTERRWGHSYGAVHVIAGDDVFVCRTGNVNGYVNAVTDVLFVNGSAGSGHERRVLLERDDPFELRVDAPPSDPEGPARFALYFWVGEPTPETHRLSHYPPYHIGTFCMPTPITDASIADLRRIANNTGNTRVLGSPSMPSVPAPSVVVDRPQGIGKPVTFFCQGIIADRLATGRHGGITNGIVVEVR